MRRREGEIWQGEDGKVRKFSRGVVFVWLVCDVCGEEEFYTESSLAGGKNRCLDCTHSVTDYECGNHTAAVARSDSRYHGFPIENDFSVS